MTNALPRIGFAQEMLTKVFTNVLHCSGLKLQFLTKVLLDIESKLETLRIVVLSIGGKLQTLANAPGIQTFPTSFTARTS